MLYNWQQPDWPNFTYSINMIEEGLYRYAQNLGKIEANLNQLSAKNRQDIIIQLMVNEAMKTSEIEGEYMSREDVLSSIKGCLGLSDKNITKDARALGIAALMNCVRETFAEPLTETMVFDWHSKLLGYARETTKLIIGGWRTHEEPMQIVSGPIGKMKVHFEAPSSVIVPKEMLHFIRWYNATAPGNKEFISAAPVRSAIAHLYFESIHPFEDGNGRIGRALSEKVLSQVFRCPIPLSISSCIERKRKMYYDALKAAQKNNEITDWLIYFIQMLLEAQQESEQLIQFTLQKTKFFDLHKNELNDRQVKVIRRMLDAGPEGFEGGMSAKKYVGITRCSKATATRDLASLVDKKILYQLPGGGRSVHYAINLLCVDNKS